MATDRQIAANRKNAALSKGPRSRSGIARSAYNSRRHGLAAALTTTTLQQAERLVAKFAGSSRGHSARVAAREAAHAAIDVERARRAKAAVFDRAVGAERADGPASLGSQTNAMDEQVLMARALLRALPDLLKLDRYEARSLARRNRAMRRLMHKVGVSGKDC